MRRYKLVIFGTNDDPQIENLSCPNDDVARELAERIARRARMVEVWHISRMVGVSFHAPPIQPLVAAAPSV